MNKVASTLLSLLLFSHYLFAGVFQDDIKPPNLSVASNGTFTYRPPGERSAAQSTNGRYWCTYETAQVSDEMRELSEYTLYEGGDILYSLPTAPGSDMYISNSGVTAFMDMSGHYKHELTVHFYSKYGRHLFSRQFTGASLFAFSPSGNKFGVGTAEKLYVISVEDGKIETYESADQFDISEDEKCVAIARRGRVMIYKNGELAAELRTGFTYPRKVRVWKEGKVVAAIDKRHLKAFSMEDGEPIFTDTLRGSMSYRDLMMHEGIILVGVHRREGGVSKGLLRAYDTNGTLLGQKEGEASSFKTFEERAAGKRSSAVYKEIPWPFAPFDSMRTVWNYYEQHMGYGYLSTYLHQGLDLITPIAEPTYAVEGGVVKCVLTIGGAIYWRMAVSPEQAEGYSRGWLYAHLIESSIQFDVGDTVRVHDYLGDIIQWYADWGHIHFVQIEDSGLVWRYDDNEWGIVYNPLLSLDPDPDLLPPVIEPVFPDSKFAFCVNETSTYLDADSLCGDIDIVIKVVDYIGDSWWQQPAFETHYWLEEVPSGETEFPRTLGQRLNHAYDFYAAGHYIDYVPLLYKRDSLLVSSSWMDMERNFYHILTNNNGDTLLDLAETALAFPTANYPDGDYRFFAEASDEYGNATVDSMDVTFNNGISGLPQDAGGGPVAFELNQNYPNPFNPVTVISYSIPSTAFVALKVYNSLGKEIEMLVNERQNGGSYVVEFDARQLPSGIYLYSLQAGKFSRTKKLLLIH